MSTFEFELPLKGSAELPPCDDETARAEAARAHARIDALPTVVPATPYDDTQVKSAVTALTGRVGALEGKPDDDTDDTARASVASLDQRVTFLEQRPAGTGAGAPGVVQIDDPKFGATDTAKMQGFLSYAAQQTRMPWGQLPARVFDTGSTSFVTTTGHKVVAAGIQSGPQNEEISSGKGVVGKWKTTCGVGSAALWQATATVYDQNVSGVVFHGGAGSQIFRSTVNSYACSFDNLTFYGCKHAFGNPTEKWLGTQFLFTGHWTVLGYTDTQFILGGGDAYLPWYLNSNSPPSTAGNGRPIIDLQGLGKTQMTFPYLTAENDWIALRVQNSRLDKSLFITGGVQEGRSPTNLATRPLIDHVSGFTVISNLHLGQVSSSSPNVSGVIHQSGGRLVLNDPLYLRGDATDPAFPLLHQTGGTAHLHRPVSAKGEQIRVRWAGSSAVEALPLPSNGWTA